MKTIKFLWVMLFSIAIAACGGGGGSSSSSSPASAAPQTLQIYKNGFFYPSPSGGGLAFACCTITSGSSSANVSMVDQITGDSSAYQFAYSNSSSAPSIGMWRIDQLVNNSPLSSDQSAYIANGHLQFDIKLAAQPSNTLGTVSVVGESDPSSTTQIGRQSSSVVLNTSSYSTTAFTHVSIPLSSVYPPLAVSKYVSSFFQIQINSPTYVGSNVPVFYINDIKWTSN